MDLTTIKDVIYIILFGISVYGWWHGRDKEKNDRTEQFVKINWKLDAVCQSQTDIKDDIRELKRNSADTDIRLSVMTEQISGMEKRIDLLENGGN